MKVLLTKPFKNSDYDYFKRDNIELVYSDKLDKETLKDVEVIIGVPSIEDINNADSLKWVQITNAGVDVYIKNRDKLNKEFILTNMTGAFGQSISEYALTYVLDLYKRMPLYYRNQINSNWHDEGVSLSPRNKNLLIVGAGDIGEKTAKLFSIFDCHITGVRRVVREVPDVFDEMITLDQLDEYLPKADIVVCALPATSASYKLFDKAKFSLMKKEAIFVNVGRGNLVNCDDLYEVCKDGKLYGAALDVTDPEPLPNEHPLWTLNNVIITPHITGGSFGHLQATTDYVYELCGSNLDNYLSGKQLKNVIDFETGYRKL